MKHIALFVLIGFSSCALLQNNQVIYQRSKTTPDTAFVYALPFAYGTSHLVVQGYYSWLSHYHNFGIDFKMKPGTEVCAARDGVVVFVRTSGTSGGIGKKYVGAANGIVIKHADGTYAHYRHLQHNGSLLIVGDTVRQGQVIGLSGSTGFSAFPHLHFEVTRGFDERREELPVRFRTEKGSRFLQPLHSYTAI